MNHKKLQYFTAYRLALSSLLSMILAHFLFHSEGFWCVFTIAAISTIDINASFSKSVLRLTGTIIGSILGYIIATLLPHNPTLIFFVTLIILSLISFISLQTQPFNYLSMVTGFTIIIIIYSIFLNKINSAVINRTLDVGLGIFVLGVVTSVLTKVFGVTLERNNQEMFNKILHNIKNLNYSAKLLIQSILISTIVSLSFLSWLYFKYPQGVWMSVSLFITLENMINQKNINTLDLFFKQFIILIIATLYALLIPKSFLIILIAISVSFWVCGYLCASQSKYASLGNQAAISVAIMLSSQGFDMTVARFLNLSFAIFISALVLKFNQSRLENL